MSEQLIVYTDGSARGNPGPGGYGVILQWGKAYKEFSEGFRMTTNNRMELMAVIVALQQLKKTGLDIIIYTDSQYVLNSVEKGWLQNWIKTGFKGKKNADLWMIYAKLAKDHKIKFNWVKGHADNPFNNRCDVLATQAADSKIWSVDEGYEREMSK